jgi:hypothetical protein
MTPVVAASLNDNLIFGCSCVPEGHPVIYMMNFSSENFNDYLL